MTPEYQTLSEVFAARHSCRGFRPGPVPREVIEQIVATAGRAPSWCNAQPWQLIVTTGAETDRFRAALQAQVTGEAATAGSATAAPGVRRLVDDAAYSRSPVQVISPRRLVLAKQVSARTRTLRHRRGFLWAKQRSFLIRLSLPRGQVVT